MTLATRLLLNGTLARAQLVVDYADQLHTAGETDNAVLLLREVLRNLPSHALARRKLEAWTKVTAVAAPYPVSAGSIPATAGGAKP
ncbi:MAG: hypothetical protein ACHQ4G_07975 [Opitutales bacterium]